MSEKTAPMRVFDGVFTLAHLAGLSKPVPDCIVLKRLVDLGETGMMPMLLQDTAPVQDGQRAVR